MKEVYCIPNAPHQNGDLWVEVIDQKTVNVMNPAGAWWRGRTFTLEEFRVFLNNMN